MRFLQRFADAADRVVLWFGRVAGVFFLLNTAVIIVDVLSRRAGYQIPGLGSTRLQELEWHFHTVLFALLLGATYVLNGHVRVDVAVTKASRRTRAWLEFFGCLLLALPFLYVVFRYGYDLVWRSFVQNEGSMSPQGLPARYIIKTVFVFGFVLFFISVLSVMARSLLIMLGGSGEPNANTKAQEARS